MVRVLDPSHADPRGAPPDRLRAGRGHGEGQRPLPRSPLRAGPPHRRGPHDVAGERRRPRRPRRRRAGPRHPVGRDRVRAPGPAGARIASAGGAGRGVPRARRCGVRPRGRRAGQPGRDARGGVLPRSEGAPQHYRPRGESFGPASIRQALFKCGAHRIGHGVTLGQDPDLLRYVVDRQIPLEVCPTSNVQTHVVASYEAHPVAEYCRAGVPITINTDNTLFSHTTTTDELWLAHTRCGIPAEALREIVLNGFRHAFIPHREKRVLLAEATPLVTLPEAA